jgi:CDGSH-type Zn-finger protein
MARLVIKTATGPVEVKPERGATLICMCGLSKTAPVCDKSHLKTRDEGEGTFIYSEDGQQRQEVSIEAEDGCCGGCHEGGECQGKCHDHAAA